MHKNRLEPLGILAMWPMHHEVKDVRTMVSNKYLPMGITSKIHLHNNVKGIDQCRNITVFLFCAMHPASK